MENSDPGSRHPRLISPHSVTRLRHVTRDQLPRQHSWRSQAPGPDSWQLTETLTRSGFGGQEGKLTCLLLWWKCMHQLELLLIGKQMPDDKQRKGFYVYCRNKERWYDSIYMSHSVNLLWKLRDFQRGLTWWRACADILSPHVSS